jgi:lipopolysaccharide/colanic/teichoic acid biosynthesis glycosyltransferase
MRLRSPSSRAARQIRFLVYDVVVAAVSPLLTLYVRDAYVLSNDGALTAAIYCLVSTAFSLIAFAAFGIRDGMPRYFSVHDAINLAKAVVVGELMTCVVLFTFTRLDGIPRSTPLIHALILGAFLVMGRAFAHLTARDDRRSGGRALPASEHIILIGLSDLSSLFIKALQSYAPGRRQVVAVLDERPDSIGRAVSGVRVFGPPAHLHSLIEEFAVHGIRIDRVVIGGDTELLSAEALAEIERVCAQRDLELDLLPRMFGFEPAPSAADSTQAELEFAAPRAPAPGLVLPAYFRLKPVIDFFAALVLIIVLAPLWILAATLVFIDVGSPILFWQQRTGFAGRDFLLHKFRTLQPPYDWRGEKVPEARRLSWIGQLLRRARLDELPQLLNVLVGDMSLVGPRPLLPQDQPTTPAVRLMVRPGITGWAQVNGGTFLTAAEKEELDEWYIRHASPWLDLRILALTPLRVLTGNPPGEQALAQARAERPAGAERAASPRSVAADATAALPAVAGVPLVDDGNSSVRSW